MRSFTDYSSQSRLSTEFDVLGVIGQGAFGEVLKVKNKLDSRLYAIKRIQIDPKNKHYNKQITREIKLLSRLNHENVVRYYSTWFEKYDEVSSSTSSSHNNNSSERRKSTSHSIEAYDDDYDDEDNDDDQISESSDSSEESNAGGIGWSKKKRDSKEELSSIDSFSDLSSSPSTQSIESESSDSTSSSNRSSKFFKSTHSVNFNLNSHKDSDSDDSVIFAENSDEKLETKKNKSNPKISQAKSKKCIENFDTFNNKPVKRKHKNRQFIYIQMEYCAGKTLKDLIEKGLYQNEDKVWCLFREILHGLNHIHEQGMIHRDLKPGNVLIDTSGHAKIGDFGLATTKFKLQKENITAPTNSGGMGDIVLEDNLNSLLTLSNTNDSHQLDSMSLSGAVGTALYVAPELQTPSTKNKYIYSQVNAYFFGPMI